MRHRRGLIVDLAPGERVVSFQLEGLDGVQVEVELPVVTPVQDWAALYTVNVENCHGPYMTFYSAESVNQINRMD